MQKRQRLDAAPVPAIERVVIPHGKGPGNVATGLFGQYQQGCRGQRPAQRFEKIQGQARLAPLFIKGRAIKMVEGLPLFGGDVRAAQALDLDPGLAHRAAFPQQLLAFFGGHRAGKILKIPIAPVEPVILASQALQGLLLY